MNNSISVLQSTKFKDVTIVLRYINEISTLDVIKRCILSEMLQDRSEKYNTKEKVSDLLDNMYGASVSTKCSTLGKYHLFELRVRALNNKFVDIDLLTEQFKVASEFLYHPELSIENFNEAKSNYIFSLQRLIDRPSSYASSKAHQIISSGYPMSDSIILSLEEVEKITLDDIKEAYNSLLNDDNCYYYVIGDVDNDTVNKLAETYLKKHDNNEVNDLQYLIHQSDYKQVSEVKPIDQSILVMMFETNTLYSDDDYWTLRLANAMFGQLPTSLLFQEVREKRSLCYSIHSSVISFEGLLGIHTGVQVENIDKAEEVILEQFNVMKNGTFSAELLETAKEMLINSLNQSEDSITSSMNLEFQNRLVNTNRTIDSITTQIKETSHNDIVNVFSKIQHKLTYKLLQEEK